MTQKSVGFLLVTCFSLLVAAQAQAHFLSPQLPLASYAGSYQGYQGKHGPMNEFGMPFRDYNIQQGFSATVTMDRDIPVIRLGSDLIGPNCHSQIGAFKRIMQTMGKFYAFYEFDPGNCTQIRGRELSAEFRAENGQPHLRVRVVDYVHTYKVPTARPGLMRTNNDYTYFTGQYNRSGN